MATVYLDRNTDTVYIDFGDGVYTAVGADSDINTELLNLPGGASELVNPDDINTDDAYSEAYDEGYRTGYDEGESEGYDAGYEDGSSVQGYDDDDLENARSEGYDDGYTDGLQAADKSEE